MRRLFFALLACLVISPAWAGSSSLNYAPSGSSGMRVTTDGTTNCTGASACNLNNIIIYGDPAATAPASQTGANQLGITTRNSALMEGVGVAGTPAGGVVSVQGVSTGTSLPAGIANGADVVEGTTTTAHGCSVVGYTVIGCLGQVDDDIKSPIAAQGNNTTTIGQVGGQVNITPTDCSLSITTGGTAQNIISASSTLHGFTIQNIDSAAGSGEIVWFSLTTAAAAATTQSYMLLPPSSTTQAGGSYTTPLGFGVNHAVSIIAATTGHKISCTQW